MNGNSRKSSRIILFFARPYCSRRRYLAILFATTDRMSDSLPALTFSAVDSFRGRSRISSVVR